MRFGSGRLFMVVAVIFTFCVIGFTIVNSDVENETKLAVFGTFATIATSIGKDYFNRDRGVK